MFTKRAISTAVKNARSFSQLERYTPTSKSEETARRTEVAARRSFEEAQAGKNMKVKLGIFAVIAGMGVLDYKQKMKVKSQSQESENDKSQHVTPRISK